MSGSDKKCCVPGCVESEGSHQTLHVFPNPNKERERFNNWIISIGGDIMSLTNEHIQKYRRVCHAHFEEKYCCRFNRLSKIAIPNLNLPESENPVGHQNTKKKHIDHNYVAQQVQEPDSQKEWESTGKGLHEGFHCDNCNGDIVGYRYACVQCSNYDLCVACEASGAHDQHYVLRVPAPRPYNEIQLVLARIRRYLMRDLDPIGAADMDNEDTISLKSEVKSENEEEEVEDIEQQAETLYEDVANHDIILDSRLSSPETISLLENEDSEVVAQNNMPIQQHVKIFNTDLKQDKNQNPLSVKSLDASESTLPSTAKRKIILKTSNFFKIAESYQPAKGICKIPSKNTQEINKTTTILISKADGANPTDKLLKLPADFLKQRETVSLQLSSRRKRQTISTDGNN